MTPKQICTLAALTDFVAAVNGTPEVFISPPSAPSWQAGLSFQERSNGLLAMIHDAFGEVQPECAKVDSDAMRKFSITLSRHENTPWPPNYGYSE